VIAKEEAITTKGSAGGGGRAGWTSLSDQKALKAWRARRAGERSCSSAPCLLRPARWKWFSVLAGRGFCFMRQWATASKPDFNRKKTSAFTGAYWPIGGQLKVTVVDNGTMVGRRGSLNVDDEGSPTQETVLIEGGILKGYLSDKLSARLMGCANTGSGRRESYQSIPMPRMTNTYMLAGTTRPRTYCVRSAGLYAVQLRRWAGGYHQREIRFLGVGSLFD